MYWFIAISTIDWTDCVFFYLIFVIVSPCEWLCRGCSHETIWFDLRLSLPWVLDCHFCGRVVMSRWVKFDTATSQLTVVSAETSSAIDTSAARVAALPMVPSSRSSVSGYLPATEWISESENDRGVCQEWSDLAGDGGGGFQTADRSTPCRFKQLWHGRRRAGQCAVYSYKWWKER